MLLAGCHREPPPPLYVPGGAFFERLDATGKRVMLEGPEGEVLGKLRLRESHQKIYDEGMRPVGRVQWSMGDGGVGPRREGLSMRRVGEREGQVVRERGEDVFEVEGVARFERTHRGWAIFDVEGGLLGAMEAGEDGWRFVRRFGDGQGDSSVRREGGRVEVLRGDEVLLVVRGAAPGDAQLLMQGVSELTLLERHFVGAWFDALLDETGGD